MIIRGIAGLTLEDIHRGVREGRRFVFYEWCISLVVISLRRPSNVYFLRADELGLWKAVPFTLISFFLGWWGLPWGLIYTPLTLVTNLSGGQDVTDEILALLYAAQTPKTDPTTFRAAENVSPKAQTPEEPPCEPSTQIQPGVSPPRSPS